jgi:SPP1 gp7 family putative phage head morphogenesis protein
LNKIDAEGPYDFPTDREKLNAFIEDLKAWLEDEILEPANFSELRNGEHWTSEYVRSSYVISRNVAIGRLFQEGVSVENPPDSELVQTRTSIKTLRDLYSRTYENLESISSDTAGVIREELTKGFAQGESPTKMARRINKRVKTIQRTRAETLARTETIRAASMGTLDEYDKAGVDVVSHAEWFTAQDDDVCPICRALDGRNFTTTEMRETTFEMEGVSFPVNLIPPAHPNCRCSVTPVVGADPPDIPLQERLPDEPVERNGNA